MDGPSHYIEAENMYIKARQAGAAADGVSASLFIQAALFHATMAQAAAEAQLMQITQIHNDGHAAGYTANWNEAFKYNPQETEASQ